MKWYWHLSIPLGYSAAAASFGYWLPHDNPALAGSTAYGAASFVLVAGALIHVVASQIALNPRLSHHVRALRASHDDLKSELAATEAKMAELTVLASDGDVARSNNEIVSEMRVLRSLLTHLNVKRGQRGTNGEERRAVQFDTASANDPTEVAGAGRRVGNHQARPARELV
ncbi:MAG: hypothetical protein EXQ91_01445 [Alphaproteobacteria bacterium]|nr:hypothetical protein [Alphaproteobacteria bacterium]